jgi:hypothetical protein
MEEFMKAVDSNRFRDVCVKGKAKDSHILETKETMWGAEVRRLNPPRLITAWRVSEDPLMILAGDGYRASEVRDHAFKVQEEAASLRGNRKLTKAKVAEAFSSMKPNVDQTKVVATVLLALKHIQTVCYNDVDKSIWTVPEDLRAWSKGRKTLWIDANAESALEWTEKPSLGEWLSDRDQEGWKIEWPIADGTMEEIKKKVLDRGLTAKPSMGAKVKKEDWAKMLGRAEAIEHLG